MKKKKTGKNLLSKIIFGIIALFLIIVLVIFVYERGTNKEEEEVFQKEGYTTSNEDAFYKKIVSDNTLDDFYADVQQERDSNYEEYYFSKESNDFIELKMLYRNKVSTTLNITSDLKTNVLEYNYELTYKTAHLLLEGSSTNNYDCEVIVNDEVSAETVQKYCDMIIDEINSYNEIKNDLLRNNQIKSMIK